MPFLLTGASGPGRIAFSRDGTGHVFGLHLAPGQGVAVRAVALPQAVFQIISTGFFASAGQIVWNRFTGPGKIALQSMYYHMDGGE